MDAYGETAATTASETPRADTESVAMPETPPANRRAAGWRIAALLRLEDVLLTGAVVLAAPLAAGRSAAGPFDPGQPVQGVLRLAAVLAALACVAARRANEPGVAPSSVTSTGALGPFSGSVMLVAISGALALGLTGQAVYPCLAVAIAVMVAARLLLPPLSTTVRRALMTPFVLVATGLFWSFMNAVFAQPLVTGGIRTVNVDLLRSLVASPAFLFLVAFSAVYYAMLVFAPRQVAAPEGGPIAWLVRYGVFLAGVVFGVGWLSAFGS